MPLQGNTLPTKPRWLFLFVLVFSTARLNAKFFGKSSKSTVANNYFYCDLKAKGNSFLFIKTKSVLSTRLKSAEKQMDIYSLNWINCNNESWPPWVYKLCKFQWNPHVTENPCNSYCRIIPEFSKKPLVFMVYKHLFTRL